MKKTILRILNYVARLGCAWGIGYLIGTLADWVLEKIGLVEMAEDHPRIAIAIWFLAVVVALMSSLLIVHYPLAWIFDKIDNKIDDIEDEDPFED